MSLAERRLTIDQRIRRDTRIGAVVLLVVAGLVYLVFGGPLPFRSHYEIEAVVPSVNELRPGSAVRVAGVDVGEVVAIERGPGTTGKVRMRIEDQGRPVHADATLKIRPRLFLEGNFFVDLRPGTGRAEELDDGGTIPLAQTAIPVQFDQILTTLDHDARGSLRTVLDEYATALRGGGAEAVNAAFRRAEGAFKGVALVGREARGLSDGDLAALVRDGERVIRALDARKADLQGLVTNFATTATALAADTEAVSATLRGLAGTVRAAGPALGDVNAALPEARAFARDVRPLLRRAPRTLDLAIPLGKELDRLVAPDVLPPLVADARPALRQLAPLVPALRDLLGKVPPVSDCVRDKLLPTLESVLDDGHLSTGLPVWREFLSANVGLASAAQNFDANGTAVRYLAGVGEQLISFGKLPTVGELFSTAPVPLLGSRPRQPARRPPFNAGARCADQDRPSLAATAAPPPRQRKIDVKLDAAAATERLRKAVRKARALQRSGR